MDKDLFKKTEGSLYKYFKYKKRIYQLKKYVGQLKSRLDKVETDIKEVNITIDYYKSSGGMSERVQTSASGNSFAEEQMCKAISKLEKEHLDINRRIIKNNHKIRQLEEYVFNMSINLNTLSEEDKRFVELKYGDRKSILSIAQSLNIAQATAYRKREDIIEIVAEFKNTLLYVG